jgi:hypothetical protein
LSSVDVIVPCYRYGRFLRQCVESVLAESFLGIRVLIIDDASPDETPEVAASLMAADSRVTYTRHAQNKGHTATYNEGIEWASADYTLLLSADDYVLPGALRRAANVMDTHPEVGFTCGRAFELGTSEFKIPAPVDGQLTSWRILRGSEFIELSGATNIVSCPTAVVRTDLLKRLGGYRHELPHTNDMEMWLRLAAHASVGILDAYQAVYRRHGENMSLAYSEDYRLSDIQQREAAIDCFIESCRQVLPNAEELRRFLFLSLARDAVRRASGAFNEGEVQAGDRFAAIALRLAPEVKGTMTWLAYAVKRRMGHAAWRTMRPAVAWARRAARSARRLTGHSRGYLNNG